MTQIDIVKPTAFPHHRSASSLSPIIRSPSPAANSHPRTPSPSRSLLPPVSPASSTVRLSVRSDDSITSRSRTPSPTPTPILLKSPQTFSPSSSPTSSPSARERRLTPAGINSGQVHSQSNMQVQSNKSPSSTRPTQQFLRVSSTPVSHNLPRRTLGRSTTAPIQMLEKPLLNTTQVQTAINTTIDINEEDEIINTNSSNCDFYQIIGMTLVLIAVTAVALFVILFH